MTFGPVADNEKVTEPCGVALIIECEMHHSELLRHLRAVLFIFDPSHMASVMYPEVGDAHDFLAAHDKG